VLILLAGILIIGSTACKEIPKKKRTVEAGSPPEVTATEREIVEAVIAERCPSFKKEEIILSADDSMEKAKNEILC
jgi:hypothetical protein